MGVNDYLIGQRFNSVRSGWFTVIRATESRSARNKLFEIEFDEYNGIKFKTLARPYDIRHGNIKNPYYPIICGVGYMGMAEPKNNKNMYDRWRNMINRCYNPEDKRYDSYGGNGVTVSERWFSFANFLEDVPKIEGYDENNLSNIQLDKDIKIKGNKIYSLETCLFVTPGQNTSERNKRVKRGKTKRLKEND